MLTINDKMKRIKDINLALTRIDMEMEALTDVFNMWKHEADNIPFESDEKFMAYVDHYAEAWRELHTMKESLEKFKKEWVNAESSIVVK